MAIPRKKLLDRKVNVRDARLYIVATEGEKTEAQYLEIFQNPRVRVVTLPTAKGFSSPGHVLKRLDAFQEQSDLQPGDERWLMVDVDRIRPEHLSTVCQEAVQKGIYLAVSNPCFEFWLLLHIAEPTEIEGTKCDIFKKELRQRLGAYNKANLDAERFKPHITVAVERAKILDTPGAERIPGCPGTHVYKLIQKLLLP